MLCSVTTSPSGWIDSELFFEWLKWFERETASKSRGQKRVLHLDGHKTHTTLECDDYAAAHDIILLGYPPKSTHGLQGLDRLHFGRVKTLWPQAVRRFEREHGLEMTKAHFLQVLHDVWKDIFTPENNRQAFVITGLTRPVQPDRISNDMMAPSQEFSTESTFPMPQSTPVRQAGQLLAIVSELQVNAGSDVTTPMRRQLSREAQLTLAISPISLTIDPELFTPQKRRRVIARHMQLAGLNVPTRNTITETSHPLSPTLVDPPAISSLGNRTPSPHPLESDDPQVLRAENQRLWDQLRTVHHVARSQNTQLQSQNAQMVIQNEHCIGLQARLNEKRKRKKNSHAGKYLQDRGPGGRVYTDVEFRDALRRDQEAANKEEEAKIRREAVAAAKRARNQWRERQLAQRRDENERAKEAWEAECEKRKREDDSESELPPKPKRARKAATPERLTRAVEKAEKMSDEEVKRLQDIVGEMPAGDDRKQAILEALEDVDVPGTQAD